MLADLADGRILDPAHPEAVAIEQLLHDRQINYFTFADWEKLDEIEVAKGEALGRPRLKITTVDEMLEAVGKQATEPAL
jgi:ferredoxin--NADP+ reductase